MLVTIYDQGIAMRAPEGAVVLAELHRPYFNQGSWDWRHENVYIPPEADSGRPALMRAGNVFHFSFPVFGGYFRHAVLAYRGLLDHCISLAVPNPMVRVVGMPSFGQVTVTEIGKERIVHLLTYVPELRGAEVQVVEDPITAVAVKVALRDDGGRIRRAYLAPQGAELSLDREGGYASVLVPSVVGHQMIAYEVE